MLKKLAVGFLQANCYISGCKKPNEGLVIDPGDDVVQIVNEISRAHLQIHYILLTHGHFDHAGGTTELRNITNAPVMIHAFDAPFLDFKPDGYLVDGQKITIGTYTIKVIHTPGGFALMR